MRGYRSNGRSEATLRALGGAVIAALVTGAGAARADETSAPALRYAGPPVGIGVDTPDHPAPEAAPAKTSDDETAQVRVEGPSGLRLEQETDSVTRTWEVVCVAPCGASISTSLRYRLAGGGVQKTEPFDLRAPDGASETLRVS